jgi:hypothetical protein
MTSILRRPALLALFALCAPGLACNGDDGASGTTTAASDTMTTAQTTEDATTDSATETTTSTTSTTSTTADTDTDTDTDTGTDTGVIPVDCDLDNLPQEGDPCAEEGQFCGPPCEDPCAFCNILACSGGQWTNLEVFPDECLSCDDVCPAVLEAKCGNGPPDQAACVSGCQDAQDACGLIYNKMLSCIGGAPTFECTGDDRPVVIGCEAEFDDLYQCL